MDGRVKALYELQSIDLELAKAQRARASLDDGAERRAQVEAARQEADVAERAFHDASAEMHDKDLNLRSVETKRQAFHDKLYAGSVTNPKELRSIEREIEMLDRQKDKLEERIIELFDIVEERKAALARAKAAAQEREEALAAHLASVRRQAATLSTRIRELVPRREQAVTGVDPLLLRRYESVRGRFGGVVVSKVASDSCSACHTQIAGGIVRELRSGKDICTCDNCGRMLHLEE